jgi:hypothetical protein
MRFMRRSNALAQNNSRKKNRLPPLKLRRYSVGDCFEHIQVRNCQNSKTVRRLRINASLCWMRLPAANIRSLESRTLALDKSTHFRLIVTLEMEAVTRRLRAFVS